MKKKIFVILAVFCFSFPGLALAAETSEPQSPSNPIANFLRSIDYTSRLKLEFDDNILLTEDNQDSDFKQVFTQTLTYKLPKDKYYFQWGYSGNYAYYNEEATGILGHGAYLLYSYRPWDGFSFGIRDDFNWLSDSKIATTIGDRVLGLGYVQNTPSIQVKYELSDRYTLTTDLYYQFLDVVDGENDDYIDNKRVGAKGQLNYNLTPQRNVIGFLGVDHSQITFPQVSEKAASSDRFFAGLKEKIIGLFDLTQEIGFESINMSDPANADDDNVDFRLSLETVFSLYTKLRLGLDYNMRNPSLRRQYTQYTSDVAYLQLSHSINPKTTALLSYSYENQAFHSPDVLIGQTVEHKDTFIQNLNLTLSRKILSWLTADVKYDYTKRDTDFAQEGYTDNKFSVSMTARY